MSVREHRLEAILAIRDENFSNALNKAQKSLNDIEQNTKKADGATKGFIETMKGTAVGMVIAGGVAKGFDMIKASVDKAFNRIDTMDNFNRTMTLMTGNAGDVRKALNQIREDVTGTAYGLDTAAKAVQGLTSSGIELGNSRKFIQGWMDAVSTYGQGTDEQLKSVTFQLTQMTAKGKANLGDLKSAMEAGIPVIKIFAEATGKSVEQVSDDISNGAVNATEFMAVMDKAFREGTKSFKGIEGMAKKAGATWEGTFSNMRAAVTRGMQSIIQGFEDGAKAAEMPGIKDTVKRTGQEMEKGLKIVGEAANFVGKHLNTLLPIIITGTEAWVAYHAATAGVSKIKEITSQLKSVDGILRATKNATADLTSVNKIFYARLKGGEEKLRILAAAKKLNIEMTTKDSNGITRYIQLTEAQKLAILGETGAISAKSLAMGVLNGQISISTALTTGLKAAWAANPIGMIAVGAFAGYKALMLLKDGLDSFYADQKMAMDYSKEVLKSSEELVSTNNKLKDSFVGTSEAAETQAIKGRSLRDQLIGIRDSSMDAGQKQVLLAEKVKALNELYPELGLEIDKVNGHLNKSVYEIDDVINKTQEFAKKQAFKEYADELYKSQAKVVVEIKKNELAMQKLEESGQKYITYTEKAGSKTQELSAEYQKHQSEIEKLKSQYSTIDADIKQYVASLDEESKAQMKNAETTDIVAKNKEEFYQKYKITSEMLDQIAQKEGKKTSKTLEDLGKLSEKYHVSMDSIAQDVIQNGITLKQWGEEHAQVLKENQKIFDEYVATTTNGFDKLKQKSTISLDEYIENLKENQAATRDWTTNMNILMQAGVTEGVIKKLNEMGPAGAAQAKRFVSELNELNDGTDISLGNLNKAAKDRLDQLEKLMGDGFTSGAKAADEAITRANFKGKGYKMGDETAQGYKPTQANLERISREITGGIEDNLNPNTRPKGTQAGHDLAEGLAAEDGFVKDKASGLADTVDRNIKPSGTYNVGLWAGQGLANGLWAKYDAVSEAASALGGVAAGAMGARLVINSPSKVTTQIGKFAGEGLEIGMLAMEDRVRSAATILGGAAVPEVPIADFNTEFGSSYSQNTNKTPAIFNLNMGSNVWSAFVNDISETQSAELRLSSAY